ncbi:hypothetical protein J4E86_004282 [Alternaria arbusti]|uniref:uncharacterized protein n=1 Tax=Alternaria arbusti TaxID=232088 RepID=UPI00221E4A50|nr:uncharacterized protein J4E86_004282 [Alternaria arbusti]KAI4958677.1 hypothetical protein J4E86_004282 [Alternaria arbusti]
MEAISWSNNGTQAETISPSNPLTKGDFPGSFEAWRPYATGLGTVALFLFGLGLFYDHIERRGSKHVILGDCGWWLRRTMMTKFNLDPNNVVFDGYKRYTKQDKIWATWINDELIHILPPKFFDDIKNQPLQKLSFLKHFMWNLHVGDMVCQRDYVKAVKSQLNFSLRKMEFHLKD